MTSATAPLRRPTALLALLAALLGCLFLTAVRPAPAQAASTITGQVVDSTTNAPVVGQTVRLRQAIRGGPGAVLATTTTDAQGNFSLGSASIFGNYVELVPGTHQTGFAASPPPNEVYYFDPDPSVARIYQPGANVGIVYALPAYITGTLVRSGSGVPVSGVKVTASSPSSSVVATTTTNARGWFSVGPIAFEDDGILKFDGFAVGRETGYFGGDWEVVPYALKGAPPLGQLAHTIAID